MPLKMERTAGRGTEHHTGQMHFSRRDASYRHHRSELLARQLAESADAHRTTSSPLDTAIASNRKRPAPPVQVEH